jgi:hypothetical protein
MPRGVIPNLSEIPNGPDLDGWREAQARLRTALGQNVTFKIPLPKVWDPDVQLDPETGEPYDPTVVPTSGGGFAEIEKRVSVVFRPIHPNVEDPVLDEPAGVMHRESVALMADPADYPDIEDAARFTLQGNEYRVTSIDADGLVETDRYVIFGEAM